MNKSCWRSKISPTKNYRLTWYKDLGLHAFGEFSMAMIQANSVMEDQCQIESGPLTFNNLAVQGTFVGVYDGHGGPEASRFIADNLFPNLKSKASNFISLETFMHTNTSHNNRVCHRGWRGFRGGDEERICRDRRRFSLGGEEAVSL